MRTFLMKKIISLLFITALFLGSCTSANPTATVENAATAAATKTPKVESTVEAVSNIKVPKEALNGLEINVLTPWYDVEAGLFDTLVREFNEKNEWGIQVKAQHQVNFTNLYDMTTSSLPSVQRPDFVIALPEHALEWNENRLVADL